MDRGYIDFARLYRFTQNMAFFVTRAKRNLDYTRRASRSIDPGTGLRSDQTIVLSGPKTSHLYPDSLRRISFFDIEKHRRLIFLTNNFVLPALTITLLFKRRWKIELFFKWIKQNLRIKAFYGTSENAVKTQVWIAISVYLLVAIIKKKLRIERTLNEILQVLSVTLFENDELLPLLTNFSLQNEKEPSYNQLNLFNF
jgi:IS4 transposase